MKNADKPAYPELKELSDQNQDSNRQYAKTRGGLTKRERFAMAAMQGILSNGNDGYRDAMIEDANENEDGYLPNTVALQAKAYADALLKQLQEDKT